jgi:uroporphyrin-3 C-methyltransferase
MTATPDNDTPAPKRKLERGRRSADTQKPSRVGKFAAGLALVLAVLALIISLHIAWLVNSKRGLSDAKGRVFQLERESVKLEKYVAQMATDLDTLRDSQGNLQDSLKAMRGEVGQGRRDWLHAEAENLLTIAQHRLNFARDAQLALEAARTADRLLAQLGDPAYPPVRRQLAIEIRALETYAKLDPDGVAQRFGQLSVGLDNLPLAPTRTIQEKDVVPIEGQGLLSEVWEDLQQLVRIRNTADLSRPLLLPEQRYYLRENLRLKLMSAQLALLHGDHAGFARNTRAAQQWLREYYDVNAAAVQAALRDLDAGLRLEGARPPELGNTLQLLRTLRATPTAQ